jgi:hypothetical protein
VAEPGGERVGGQPRGYVRRRRRPEVVARFFAHPDTGYAATQ